MMTLKDAESVMTEVAEGFKQSLNRRLFWSKWKWTDYEKETDIFTFTTEEGHVSGFDRFTVEYDGTNFNACGTQGSRASSSVNITEPDAIIYDYLVNSVGAKVSVALPGMLPTILSLRTQLKQHGLEHGVWNPDACEGLVRDWVDRFPSSPGQGNGFGYMSGGVDYSLRGGCREVFLRAPSFDVTTTVTPGGWLAVCVTGTNQAQTNPIEFNVSA